MVVNQVYQSAFTPLESIKVYLFTSSGSYQGINATTDSQGQVTFNLPQQDYKVRADYLGGQYWSDVFNSQNTAIDINHGYPNIHVTETGTDIYDAPVYLFTEAGSYLGRVIRTDSAGMARFLIPAKAYKFRVDYNGTQYWSDVVNVLSNEETTVDLQLDLLAMNLTNDPNPVRFDGKPPEFKSEPLLLASLFDISGILSQSVVAVVTPITDEKIYYYVNDHLGTPQRIIDETGAVVWNADYQPFGEADVNPNSTVVNNFRLPGQYYDSETVLHYNYHRHYNPKLGRYSTADPIGIAGGVNLYGYALNNPIKYFDFIGFYCERLSPWQRVSVYESANNTGTLTASISKKKWKKVSEANALPLPSRSGDVVEVACICQWELVSFVQENTYMKDVLYEAKFKCGINECPKREWEETQFKYFIHTSIVEEPTNSLFMSKVTTTSGFYDNRGCNCPEPI
ncbi:MAG: RHS repeat-associated core domain-containing protein [Pseudomonadota bacterium]